MPEITLLIPCYNEEKTLKRKILNCLELSYPQIKEIIIIDDFSTDKTSQIAKVLAKKNSKITFLSNRFQKGKAGAVLTGIKHATTDLICISDADVLLEKKSLEKIASFFEDPKVGMVGGALKPVVFNPKTKRYLDIRGFLDRIFYQIQRVISRIDSTPIQHGQFVMIKKSLGVFPHPGIQAEDIDLAVRNRLKGFRSLFAPQSFFWEEIIIGKNDFAIRYRRSQGIVLSLWRYKYLLFNSKYDKFGLICYPLYFFLYLLQPGLLFVLTLVLFLFLSLPFKIFLILAILFIPPLKSLFYIDGVLILSLLKAVFSKEKITDSWDTRRI